MALAVKLHSTASTRVAVGSVRSELVGRARVGPRRPESTRTAAPHPIMVLRKAGGWGCLAARQHAAPGQACPRSPRSPAARDSTDSADLSWRGRSLHMSPSPQTTAQTRRGGRPTAGASCGGRIKLLQRFTSFTEPALPSAATPSCGSNNSLLRVAISQWHLTARGISRRRVTPTEKVRVKMRARGEG